MESTGKYWIPIYNVLEKDCNIVLAHPNPKNDHKNISALVFECI